jgi:hypothetical protein
MNLNHCKAEIDKALSLTTLRQPADRRDLALFLADLSREIGGDPDASGDGITVTIGRRVPSQNASTYAHWRDYKKEKDAWAALLRAALKPRMKAPHAMVFVTIVSYRQKLCDYANLVGGAKPIPDTLIKLRYLHDDSPEWMRASYHQHKCARADERTVITIHLPD